MTKSITILFAFLLLTGCGAVVADKIIGVDEEVATSIPEIASSTPAIPIPKLEFNDEKITVEFTDNNDGEELIIRSDEKIYGGWDSAEVTFSIENTSTTTSEDVDIKFFMGDTEAVTVINELKEDVEYEVDINDYGDVDFWDGEATTTRKEVVSTHKETRYKDEWNPIALANISEKLDVDEKLTAKKKATYNLPASETKYFQATITFPNKSRSEFWIEATGTTLHGRLDPWINSDWLYRKTITIDNDVVYATETDFTILATTTDTDLKDNAQADGDDIVFTDSTGSVKLDHEIELYDNSTGELVAWVQVPELKGSSSPDTVLYMYYGNGTTASQQNVEGTWNSNYLAVWHMPNNAGSAKGDVNASTTDSTVNNKDGNIIGTASTTVAGQFDGSFQFDGATGYMNTPSVLGGDDTYTLQGWLKGTVEGAVMSNASTGSANQIVQFRLSTGGAIQMLARDDASNAIQVRGTNDLTDDEWHQVAYLQVANNDADLMEDGAEVVYNTKILGTLGTQTLNINSIGAHKSTGAAGTFWLGNLDEIRVSNISLSQAWISTEYNNQSDVATFLSFGAEEAESVEEDAILQALIF